MSAARRGNPYLTVRLPREAHEQLHEAAGKGDGGAAGGAALFVRRLIYRELGELVPSQWEKSTAEALEMQNDLITDSCRIDRWEREGIEQPAFERMLEAVKGIAAKESDPINRTLALQMLGRLTLLSTTTKSNS